MWLSRPVFLLHGQNFMARHSGTLASEVVSGWRYLEGKVAGEGVRGTETEDDPLNFCTKIQMWHLGFIAQDPLWCLESRSVAQCRAEAMQEA